jgi:hypothetical protein
VEGKMKYRTNSTFCNKVTNKFDHIRLCDGDTIRSSLTIDYIHHTPPLLFRKGPDYIRYTPPLLLFRKDYI